MLRLLFAAALGVSLIQSETIEKPVKSIQAFESDCMALAVSHDGKTVASVAASDNVVLWEMASWRRKLDLTEGELSASCAAFSPDDKKLAVGTEQNETLRIFSTEDGEEVETYELGNGGTTSVAYGGKFLVAGGLDVSLCVIDPKAQKIYRKLPGYGSINSMAFSPDGKSLATADTSGSLRIWDTETWSTTTRLEGMGAELAYSPNGKLLAVGSGGSDNPGRVVLLEVDGWKTKATFTFGKGAILAVAFSADGKWLAASSEDEFVQVASVETQALGPKIKPKVRSNEEFYVYTIVSTPDSKHFVTGSSTGRIEYWPLPSP
jgi:WD40 repeat protein